MSDATLRELERLWKKTGSVDAEARCLVEQVRTGKLAAEHLATAAYCRHPAAQLAVGDDARPSPDEPEAWLLGLTADVLTPHAAVLWCLGVQLRPLLPGREQATAAAVLSSLATICARVRAGRIPTKQCLRLFDEFEASRGALTRLQGGQSLTAHLLRLHVAGDQLSEAVFLGWRALIIESALDRCTRATSPLNTFGADPAAGLASAVVRAHEGTVEALASARRSPSGLLRRLTGRDTDPSGVLVTARRAVALWALGRDFASGP